MLSLIFHCFLLLSYDPRTKLSCDLSLLAWMGAQKALGMGAGKTTYLVLPLYSSPWAGAPRGGMSGRVLYTAAGSDAFNSIIAVLGSIVLLVSI